MEWTIIAGYAGALIMGITLGLLGAGGSILTVPVLYYLFGVDAVLSTAYSLFIVGFTALAGQYRICGKDLYTTRPPSFFHPISHCGLSDTGISGARYSGYGNDAWRLGPDQRDGHPRFLLSSWFSPPSVCCAAVTWKIRHLIPAGREIRHLFCWKDW